jgi:hypothetical protein
MAAVINRRDGYTTTADARPHPTARGAVRLTVRTAHTPEAWADRAENHMVWVDGRLAAQHYGGGAVAVSFDPAARTATAVYDLTPDQARRNSTVVTAWNANSREYPAVAEVSFGPLRPPLAGRVLRTAFHAVPDPWGPGTTAELKAAGFNTLTCAAFVNPVWNAAVNSFDAFVPYFRENVLDKVTSAKAAGLSVLLTGDDLMRSGAEERWLAETPWAERAVRHAARLLGETGVCVGLETIDEFNKPFGHELTARVLGWWRGECLIPVTFPYLALDTARPWESEADYLSRYTTLRHWRDYGEKGATVWQWWDSIRDAAKGVGERPWLCLASCCGDFEAKGRHVNRPGVRPEAVTAQAWLALAAGASGLRYYALDTWWRHERQAAAPGAVVQTGSGPAANGHPGDERWPALSSTFRAIAAREGLLAQPAAPVAESFPWVFGSRPGLSWAVNVTDGTESAPFGGVLLTPAGESPVSAGVEVPAGGVVLSV